MKATLSQALSRVAKTPAHRAGGRRHARGARPEMIVTALLFAAGILMGLRLRVSALVAASVVLSCGLFAAWWLRDEFDDLKGLVWLAWLTALQTGYVVGGYLGAGPDRTGS